MEVGDAKSPTLQKVLPHALVEDLKKWAIFFLSNFDENVGFSSPQAQAHVTSEFESFCIQLDRLGVQYRAVNWWSDINFSA